ncbi:MAG: nucleotidyltransferase domain-containing protein [Candidatus Bathyarchaeia archaeon]
MRKKSSGFVRIRYAPSKGRVKGLVKKYLKDIKGKVGLKLAIIFGSYAKDSYSWGSDVDIFLVAKNLPKRVFERSEMLIDPDFPVQIELFAYTPEEFVRMIKDNHPLVNEVLQNGEIIYANVEYKRFLRRLDRAEGFSL